MRKGEKEATKMTSDSNMGRTDGKQLMVGSSLVGVENRKQRARNPRFYSKQGVCEKGEEGSNKDDKWQHHGKDRWQHHGKDRWQATNSKQLIVRSNLARAEKRKQRAGNAVVTATKLTKEKVAKEQLPEGETKVLKPKIACLKGKSTR